MNRVPFSFDQKDGFVSVRGTVFLDGDDLVVETAQALLQLVPFGKRTYRIPADDIEYIAVEAATLRKARLVVRPFSFEHVAGFPGETAGAIALPIGRKHREAAEALVREACLRNLPR